MLYETKKDCEYISAVLSGPNLQNVSATTEISRELLSSYEMTEESVRKLVKFQLEILEEALVAQILSSNADVAQVAERQPSKL